MGVFQYQKDGQTLWRVYVRIRSKIHKGVDSQKERKAIPSEKEALKLDRQLREEAMRELIAKECQDQTWGRLVNRFSEYLDSSDGSHLLEMTRREYLATVCKHTKMWWSKSAEQITPADVKELFKRLSSEGYSVGHSKKIKNVMARIFVFGIEKRIVRGIHESPTVGVKLGREEESIPEILTLSQIRSLLTLAKEAKSPWFYHWAVALLTGMRSGELFALDWSDIDFEHGTITVSKSYCSRTRKLKCTKSGCWRTVPVSSDLKALLLEIKASSGSRNNVLEHHWIWKQGLQAGELRKFCKGVGLPSIRFHTLRACFATQLIRNSVPPIQLQKICGWKDLKTMQRYIRMAGIEVDGATEVLKLLPDSEISEKVVSIFSQNSS